MEVKCLNAKLDEQAKETRWKETLEKETWVKENGSEYLKMLVEEGLDYEKTYRRERLLKEHPDWETAYKLPRVIRLSYDVHEPPMAILSLFKKVKSEAASRGWPIGLKYKLGSAKLVSKNFAESEVVPTYVFVITGIYLHELVIYTKGALGDGTLVDLK
jgi:hypothetical protein